MSLFAISSVDSVGLLLLASTRRMNIFGQYNLAVFVMADEVAMVLTWRLAFTRGECVFHV